MFSILDTIPIAGVLALTAAFVKRQRSMRREERDLLEKLEALKAAQKDQR